MAKPKLALIPAAQGTKFYSVLPSNATGDFTFTRGSVATRINAQGLIENVASGQSRLNYPLIDGVQKGCPHHILEPARTQIFQYSEDFSIAYWTKTQSSITSNATISPDGTLNADEFVEDFSNTNHRVFASQIPVVSGNSYSFSLFAKYKNLQYLQLTFNGSQFNNNQFATFDLINGVVSGFSSGVANIEKHKNGWYRLIFTATATVSSNTGAYIITSNVPNLRDPSYQGNGSSVYIFGAMLEQGSYPTSYIPNNGNAAGVTRSAETANGAGQSSTFNDSEGVLMAEISALADDGTSRYISLSDGTSTNRINIFLSSSNTLKGLVRPGTGSIETNVNILLFNKAAYKYKSGDKAFWVNGFKVGVNSETTIPSSLNELSFDLANGQNFYGKTKQVQYFDSALADTQLEQLTSWQSFRDMAEGQLYTIE